jgi:hypothetical protein
MIQLSKTFGRFGNSLFQYAFLYAYARDAGTDHYFQDPAFFEGHEQEIKLLYSEGLTQKIDMVAIHVRRGDYVGHPLYVDLMKTDYYKRAMEEFPEADFLVFSDDIKWCRQQEIFKKCQFHHKDEIQDFNTMASCVGIIMANSSFSWWASYIAPWAKKIIAPSEWFNGDKQMVLPDNFVKI